MNPESKFKFGTQRFKIGIGISKMYTKINLGFVYIVIWNR